MGMNDKAKELAAIILNTKEFGELKQARSIIYKNYELRGKVDAFVKEEEALYSGRLSASDAEKRAAALKKVFEGLSSIPEVDRFLKAQKSFSAMLQNVYKIINDTLDATLKS